MSVDYFDEDDISRDSQVIFGEFLKDQEFHKQDIESHIADSGKIYQKWAFNKSKAEEYLQKMEDGIEDAYMKLEKEYEHSDDARHRALASTKTGLKKLIESNTSYKKLQRKVKSQKRIVNDLTRIVDYLHYHGNDKINNTIKILELESRGY